LRHRRKSAFDGSVAPVSSLSRAFIGLLAALIGLVAVVALGVAVFTASLDLPPVEKVREITLKVPLRIHTRDGVLIGEFGEERRIPVAYADVPPLLIKAVLAAEDHAFFTHPGIDLTGVIRAALANLRAGHHEQGASTITMQVARNYFLTPEKTYTRKVREILLAFDLERSLTKEQILELYLNKIFLGQRAYGFAAAARVYFGKLLPELDLAEMALLAGLPRAPSRDNPVANPANARLRRDYVLERMRALGEITQAEADRARQTPVPVTKHLAEVELEAPYVAEMARAAVLERHGESAYSLGWRVYTTVDSAAQRSAERALRKGILDYDHRHGWRGRAGHVELAGNPTPEAQARALAGYPSVGGLVPAFVTATKGQTASFFLAGKGPITLDWGALSWARKHLSADALGAAPKNAGDILAPGDVVYLEPMKVGWKLAQIPQLAGALVTLRPSDGAILALSGGFDFRASKFNRATQAQRQPGSTLKPFIYSAALEHGFTPATLVSGGPIAIEDGGEIWRPENYGGRITGQTRLREALAQSLNLVSVRVLRAVGMDDALSHLSRFGFERKRLSSGLSLALGAGAVTPSEMARAFAVFANGGFLVEPYIVEHVEDQDGKPVEQAQPRRVCETCDSGIGLAPDDTHAPRVLSAENRFLMTHMMGDVIRTGTGRAAMALGRQDLAGKTGTTNEFKDAWFAGFQREVVSVAWVGFDEPATLGAGEAGALAALPIWIEHMRDLLKDKTEQALVPPPNVVVRYVRPESGALTSDTDPSAIREFFIAGIEPLPALEEAPPLPVGGGEPGREAPRPSATEELF
jgi:penicillin-binding protein 1A